MIQLGDLAKDRITGYAGIVVCVQQWLHGCRRISLQARELKDGKPVDYCTFDEPQVELLAEGVEVGTGDAKLLLTGGPQDDPAQHSTPSQR